MQNALMGKYACVFTSSGNQHGGNETTLLNMMIPFFHMGMMMVGLPPSWKGQSTTSEIVGGSPLGMTTIASGDGSRMPSKLELEGAKEFGRHFACVVTGHITKNL